MISLKKIGFFIALSSSILHNPLWAKLVDVEISLGGYVCTSPNVNKCSNSFQIFTSKTIQVDDAAVSEEDAYNNFIASADLFFKGVKTKVYLILWNKVVGSETFINSSSTYDLRFKRGCFKVKKTADGGAKFKKSESESQTFSYDYGDREFVKVTSSVSFGDGSPRSGKWIFPSVTIKMINP